MASHCSDCDFDFAVPWKVPDRVTFYSQVGGAQSFDCCPERRNGRPLIAVEDRHVVADEQQLGPRRTPLTSSALRCMSSLYMSRITVSFLPDEPHLAD
eukprot:2233306-Pyramimonas_sp.AAC.1